MGAAGGSRATGSAPGGHGIRHSERLHRPGRSDGGRFPSKDAAHAAGRHDYYGLLRRIRRRAADPFVCAECAIDCLIADRQRFRLDQHHINAECRRSVIGSGLGTGAFARTLSDDLPRRHGPGQRGMGRGGRTLFHLAIIALRRDWPRHYLAALPPLSRLAREAAGPAPVRAKPAWSRRCDRTAPRRRPCAHKHPILHSRERLRRIHSGHSQDARCPDARRRDSMGRLSGYSGPQSHDGNVRRRVLDRVFAPARAIDHLRPADSRSRFSLSSGGQPA
jgi:hypothetical protein